MGYESRILVVDKMDNDFGSIIADLKLSRMPREFVELFNQKADFDVYITSEDKPTKTDCYGKELKCAKLVDVYDWLEANEQTEYRRQTLARYTLQSFIQNSELWNDCNLYVVHYGY